MLVAPKCKEWIFVVADVDDLESGKDFIFEPLEPGRLIWSLFLSMLHLEELSDEYGSWEQMKDDYEDEGMEMQTWEELKAEFERISKGWMNRRTATG